VRQTAVTTRGKSLKHFIRLNVFVEESWKELKERSVAGEIYVNWIKMKRDRATPI
jgi:hypothetical protein